MRVVIYTSPGCTSCAQAKAFLAEHNVVFNECSLAERPSVYPRASHWVRKLAIDGEKTLQGSQNLRTSRASRWSAFSV